MNKQKILETESVTHNVVRLKVEKPSGLKFEPGQAVDFALDKPEWKDELRPFTFTSLPQDDHLEFTIKVYPERKGVTDQIGKLKAGESVLLGDVFGDINYKGDGVFIAGGAGITPFLSVFKQLNREGKLGNNKLLFANKKEEDIIDRKYLDKILGPNFVNVLSDEKVEGIAHGHITKKMISSLTDSEATYFYVCGPPPMMDAVLEELKDLGVSKSKIVHEEF